MYMYMHAVYVRPRALGAPFIYSFRWERKSSFPTHQYRLHRYLATLVFSARSKSLFGCGPLLLRPVPSSSPYRAVCIATHVTCNYTKRPTRDDAGVKREIGRVPCVCVCACVWRRVPPFENCPSRLLNATRRLPNCASILVRAEEDVRLFSEIGKLSLSLSLPRNLI